MAAKYSDYAKQGWKDYRQGVVYPLAYDTWAEVDQRNYENGRMRAANYKLATGGRLPPSIVSKGIYAATTAIVGAAFHDPRRVVGNIPRMRDTGQRARVAS